MPTISLRITDEQKQKWTEKANGKPLSDWIKGQCDGAEKEVIPPYTDYDTVAQHVEKAKLPKVSKFDDIDETVARRSGHELGCNCLGCYQQGAFMRKSRAESAK